MANYMAEVAEMLGLELGESFRVANDDSLKSYYFRFTNIGLEFSTSNEDGVWVTASSYTLFSLLRGELAIIKLPWKPRKGEMYYFPDMGTSSLGSCLCWLGTETDKNLYDRGFVFQTIEEAIATAKRILAIVQEGKNNG